jgi:predicted dehydrogenase
MTMRLGVIGSSEGNGHPFSFAAIVNGYDPIQLRAAGWGPIADYLAVRDPIDFGIGDVLVTHAWCPERSETEALCRTAEIPHTVGEPHDMIGDVDGVLIARDDWESHRPLAIPFLEAGVPVFLDKPLSLDAADLESFRPHLWAGRLMSCSGYRFAPELDSLRAAVEVGPPPMVLSGIGPRDWDRYAVHLVEPLLALTTARPVGVVALQAGHDAGVVELSDGSIMMIDCLGDRAPGFVLNVTYATNRHEIVLADRFSAFRRLLRTFAKMVETQEPGVDPDDTLTVMEVLMARRTASATSRFAPIDRRAAR